MGVALTANYDVVDEPAMHVAKHTGSEVFCDEYKVDGCFGVVASVGLVMGYPVLLHYFS